MLRKGDAVLPNFIYVLQAVKMEDLIKQLQSQLKERAASPLLSAFVISWVLWNYRFLVILFSDATISQTFQLIDKQYSSLFWDVGLHGFIYPLLTTLIYLFVYPYPAKYVYEFTSWRQKELRELKQKVEDQTPLTLEESRAIRNQLYRVEADSQEQMRRKDDEIKRLKEEIKEIRQLESEQKQKREESNQIPFEGLVLLKKIAEESPVPVRESILLPSRDDLILKMKLNDLEHMGLISKNYDMKLMEYVYGITQDGRRYIK